MPCFLLFVIGHIAGYAPSSKFQNQQKYRSKLLNLFFHHYLAKRARPVWRGNVVLDCDFIMGLCSLSWFSKKSVVVLFCSS